MMDASQLIPHLLYYLLRDAGPLAGASPPLVTSLVLIYIQSR